MGPPTIGHLILAISGMLWAVYGSTIRRRGMPSLHATAIVAVGSALFYLPVYMAVLPKAADHASLAVLLTQGCFQGVLVSVVAVYAFSRSVELLGSVATTALPALMPLVTAVISAAILQEHLSWTGAAAAVAIGAGVCLAIGNTRRSNAQQGEADRPVSFRPGS
jgi:drug/metabolite transporter (DMT)-like permease